MKVRTVRKYAKPYKSAKRFEHAAAPHLHKVSATSTTKRNWPMANKTGGVLARFVCAVYLREQLSDSSVLHAYIVIPVSVFR